jgi:uncharacterized membrane protein YozB (DUF420 family)
MGFPDSTVIIITANLAVQITILCLLIAGYWLKTQLKLRQHGIVMSTAVILHLILIFSVMIPSFVLGVIPYYVLQNPAQLVSVVSLVHAILGSVAALVGVFLVVSWRFRKDVQGCLQRKKFMPWTLGVWAVALIFGVLMYSLFIGPLLMG